MPKQKLSKAEGRGANEITIHEALPLLGFDDTTENLKEFYGLLGIHGVMWRSVDTRHGPQAYFDKKILAELKRVMEVNKERRGAMAQRKEVEEDVRRLTLPQGSSDNDM